MPFQAYPTHTKIGTYRVKVYDAKHSKYWKYIPDSDRWIQLSVEGPVGLEFNWIISPVSDDPDIFNIRPAYDENVGLVPSIDNDDSGYKFPQGRKGPATRWRIEKSKAGEYSKIWIDRTRNVLDARDSTNRRVNVYPDQDSDEAFNQRFVFELVDPIEQDPRKTFEQLWFQLTPEKAATQTYDIIVIGTGMGGGTVAGDLFNTNSRLGTSAKSVLVIEKGGLVFHSHCLNTARPSGLGQDRGQQNDTFFALFKDDYQFADEEQAKEWKAGPMFNLGGRGAAWGLFAPRIHDKNLIKKFGERLHDELVRTWYKKAEELMDLSLPKTQTIHQNLMERLNIETGLGCQWQWGRIASEFSESRNFDFAVGAFSPIDKLLEIAMSTGRDGDGACIEHSNWKILLNTEVRSIIWDDHDSERAAGVVVRDANGNATKIFLKKETSGKTRSDTSIVLGAGSVGSPSILMRSGMNDYLKDPRNNALHLTDHDIFAKSVVFRYLDPSVRKKVGSMKLQSYVHLGDTIGLVNMAIDASSFLPREFLTSQSFSNEAFPELIAAFILPVDLNEKNTIDLDDNDEPVLTAGREFPFSNDDETVKKLRELTKAAIGTTKDALGIEIRPTDPDDNIRKLWLKNSSWDDKDYFKPLQLGGVAHELGTLPLKCHDNQKEYIVDPDLQLRTRKGIYVCDLSIFPFSPEVNPTLTLVALALRLSKSIHNPTPYTTSDLNTVYVINETGELIKIFVSNRAGVTLQQEEIDDNKAGTILKPGAIIGRVRLSGVDETVMVYRLDYNTNEVYLPTPIPHIASPGRVRIIG